MGIFARICELARDRACRAIAVPDCQERARTQAFGDDGPKIQTGDEMGIIVYSSSEFRISNRPPELAVRKRRDA